MIRIMIVHVIRAMLLSAIESDSISSRSNSTRTRSLSTATREPTSRYSGSVSSNSNLLHIDYLGQQSTSRRVGVQSPRKY